jgi:hypothetical protein
MVTIAQKSGVLQRSSRKIAHIGRRALLNEVCTSLKISPLVYASRPTSADLFFRSVLLYISKTGSPDGMRSCKSTSEPKKTLEETLEAASDLAIHLLQRELNIEIDDSSYEMKKILVDRKKVFNSQISRLDATSADLMDRKKSMRNVWATTLEEMKDLSV